MDIKECCGDEGDCRNYELIKELEGKLDEWKNIANQNGFQALKLADELKAAESRLDELQKKHTELHRRCQLAEGAVLRKMEAEQVAGAPIAKRLAMAGFAAEQERRIELEGRLDKALERMDRARKILTSDSPTPGNWGVLDTTDLREPVVERPIKIVGGQPCKNCGKRVKNYINGYCTECWNLSGQTYNRV